MEESLSAFEEKYTVLNRIGEGGFGHVYAGMCNATKRYVAIKYAEKCTNGIGIGSIKGKKQKCDVKTTTTTNSKSSLSSKEEEELPFEITALMKCKDLSCVIQMMDYFTDDPEHYIIVMEKPSLYMDLFDYIDTRRVLSEKVAKYFFKQVLDAVVQLYSIGIVHRDIKTENIIVDQTNLSETKLKLIDFGSAAYVASEPFTDVSGTKEYCAPECLTKRPYYSVPITVWSLGILLYEMLIGSIPFKPYQKILDRSYKISLKSDLSIDVCHLIKICLIHDYEKRPTFQTITNHAWLKKRQSSS